MSDVCDPITGNCICRRNLQSTCFQPLTGFFCPHLDFLVFEAEGSAGDLPVVRNFGNPGVDFTGTGYVELALNQGLTVQGITVPYSGLYQVVLRYSTRDNSDFSEVAYYIEPTSSVARTSDLGCDPLEASEEGFFMFLSSGQSMAVRSSVSYCLTANTTYSFLVVPRTGRGRLLVDSIVLFPLLTELEVYGILRDPARVQSCERRLLALGGRPPMSVLDSCLTDTCSVAYEIYDGPLGEWIT